jgi:3-oxoacyl-[acyl-carrier protein] reductase
MGTTRTRRYRRAAVDGQSRSDPVALCLGFRPIDARPFSPWPPEDGIDGPSARLDAARMNESEVVVVVGAAGGIGAALCQRLAARGVYTVLAGRNEASLAALKEALPAGQSEVLTVDARDMAGLSDALRSLVERTGRLDGIVNLAGSILLKPAHLTQPDEFDAVIAQNLRTAFATVRAAVPLMSRERGGAIVLVSSAAARIGFMNHDAIAAAKAGVIGLMLSSAATYASRGIRINAVAPGLVRTPLAQAITGNAAALKVSESMHALGRIAEPDEVASMIDWLLHPTQRFITGQTFGIDGGLGTLRAR